MPSPRLGASLLALMACLASAARPGPVEPDGGLSPGWVWTTDAAPVLGEPEPDAAASTSPRLRVLHDQSTQTSLMLALTWLIEEPGLAPSLRTEHRAHFFGPDGEPIPSRVVATRTSATHRQDLVRLLLTDKPLDAARIIARIATITPEGRVSASREALDRARRVGADAMPLPAPGNAYAFELPALDGGVVRSSDFAGKIVLIDFWATWCIPCMDKMPALRALADRYPDDLVVVGVNMDDDPGVVRAELAKGVVPGRQIHAASTSRGDARVWESATGIRTIPRVFLVDRDGVFVADMRPEDIEGSVTALVGAPSVPQGEGRDANSP